MASTINYDFKTIYMMELKGALIRESNGRLKIDVADKVANSYVENLVFTGDNNIELLHKDPASIASDMINGMKPEMFITD